MNFYYRCPNCGHFEKRDEQVSLICPSCETEMEQIEPATDRRIEELYSGWLDEVYGSVEICGLTYSASDAFESVDPIAFRCGRNDWLDSEINCGLFVEFDGETFEVSK